MSFLILFLLLLAPPQDAPPPDKNPLAGDAEAIKAGADEFRVNCAVCHGLDARGGNRGPDLVSGRRTHGDSDAVLYRNISKGIPGTDMQGSELTQEQVWQIIAWLRSQSMPPASSRGDRAAGEKLFFGTAACAQCHMVRGKGGRLGPDLTRVGAARSVRYLAEAVRQAGKDITNGFESITVVTADGRRITGVRRNEDAFSVQVMDEKEELHSFFKKNLKEVTNETRSLMPDYSPAMLKDSDLENLVAYMESLRGR